MLKKLAGHFLWLFIFAVSMAFIESAVVVYLRIIFYPEGFAFPLKFIESPVLGYTELFREIATMVMLLSVSAVSAKKSYERFAHFLFTFGVWDIFYYLFLKLLLGWPESVFTWDILFLIPTVWIGPVLAPVICSILMIAISAVIVYFYELGREVRFFKKEWGLLISGALIFFLTFIYDFSMMYIRNGREGFFYLASVYIPKSFHWLPFSAACLFVAASITVFYRRNTRQG